jgi:porin
MRPESPAPVPPELLSRLRRVRRAGRPAPARPGAGRSSRRLAALMRVGALHGLWLLSAAPLPALAQSVAPGGAAALRPGAAPSGRDAAAPAALSATSPPQDDTLLGDMAGLRPWLDDRGLSVGLQETSEYLFNTAGGVRRGGAYHGMTQFGLGLDTARALGVPGGVFNVSGLQIHGPNWSPENLQTLQGPSGIEANAGTRLWELWYQQSFGDAVDVKLGQQSLDQEFMLSSFASAFTNITFGWPALPSADMPAGGPAYPLSSLGARVRTRVSDAWTLLGGVFDGNPAGTADGDPQRANPHGTRFSLGNGLLLIGEAQYTTRLGGARALPGTYKLGAWYNTQRAADLRRDRAGLSLADPRSSGEARLLRGNYGIYAIADQTVWRPDADSPRALGVFVAAMAAPGDRNPVGVGVNLGMTLQAPLPGRDSDVAGIALGYAGIGAHARGLDRDTGRFTMPGYPVRTAETVLEVTYQYQLTPWWQWQADFQYAIRPAGGIPDPTDPERRLRNEAIVGVRTSVTF